MRPFPVVYDPILIGVVRQQIAGLKRDRLSVCGRIPDAPGLRGSRLEGIDVDPRRIARAE